MEKERKKKCNVPNLRFPGFEGEWVSKKLGELAEISSGGTPSRNTPEFWNGGIPWITTSLINFNVIKEAEEFITEQGVKESSAKLFPRNTILMAMYGQGKTRGQVAILDIEATTNQACAAIMPKPDLIDYSFLYQNLLKRYDEIRDLSNQGGQQNLSGGIIKGINILFPSVYEQSKIAELLSKIDSRIETQSKIINDLESLMTQLNHNLLSQKIKFQKKKGDDLAGWNYKKIGEILKVGSGKDYKHLNRGDIPVYGTGGVITYVNSYIYDGETVCIGRKGTIDKPMYHNGKIWNVDTLFYTHSFVETIPKFIYYVFKTINWKEHNEASGVPSLSKNTIEKIEIPVPSKDEQIFIATILTSVEEKIKVEKKIFQSYGTQKQHLLANLFI